MAQANAFSRLGLGAKIGIGIGIPTLIAIAYVVVFYGDVSSAIQAAKRQEQTLSGELDSVRGSQQAYQRDLAELKDREQRQRDLNKVLPETSDLPSFLSAIQSVSNVAGITLESWAPMDEVRAQYYAKVPMKLTIRGKFHQVAKFFWSVGQLDRIINVENITLSPAAEVANEEIYLSVSCLATAFHTLKK